jgi:hypothetical protein
MPKLSTETAPLKRGSQDYGEITRLDVQRLQPAFPAENQRTGEVTPYIGFIYNNVSRFVRSTPEICAKIIGELDESGAGFRDPLYMSHQRAFFVGLAKTKNTKGENEDICVRLDSATIPPETPPGVKTENDTKNNQYLVRYDDITGSYDVEEAPRGTPVNDVLLLLNLLDSHEEIKAGLQLNRSLRVVSVNPPHITISRPPLSTQRMIPGR